MVNAGKIKGLILVVIFASVLFSVAVSVVPTLVSNMYGLTTNLSADSTALGSGAATLIGNSNTYFGWFLAVGLILMFLGIAMGIFAIRKGKGRRRYRR